MGSRTIKVSISIFTLTEVSSSIASSLQPPPGTGFHGKDMGWQFVRKRQRNETPYPPTIPIMNHAAHLNLFVVKMTVYSQRIESLQKTVPSSHRTPLASKS